jgi:flavin reductase (DIM6/NTAB) family NADH-FMN oxidoreductase RutF
MIDAGVPAHVRQMHIHPIGKGKTLNDPLAPTMHAQEPSAGARAGFEHIDLQSLAYADRYKLLIGSVIPRPIAFVSTLNEDGSANAAPFSSFMIASAEAGYLAFSIGPGSAPKGTLRNIQRDGQFVINMVPEELAREVQLCGEDHPPEVRKLELARLALLSSERIAAPRIARTKIQFECLLHTIIRLGESHMIVGKVVLMHAQAGLIESGRIDPIKYAPLGRIAGRNYCAVRDIISV